VSPAAAPTGGSSNLTPAAFVAPHDRVLSPLEQAALRERRRRLVERACGRVLDLGGGAGEHLRAYLPDQVSAVDVVGPDPFLGPILDRRVKGAAVPLRVVRGGLDQVEGPYDTALLQFVGCAVPDLDALVRRLGSLLHPDHGLLLFLEHVPARPGRSVLTAVARPVWRQLAAGCDLTSDLPAALRRSGYAVIDIERFTMRTMHLPIRACATGAARLHRTTTDTAADAVAHTAPEASR
jgi:SAM-dependent methyltransferase